MNDVDTWNYMKLEAGTHWNSQTPLGKRSTWAIDRSPQIERTAYDTHSVSERGLMFSAQLSLRRTNRSVRRTVSTSSQRRQTLSRRFLAYIASVLCISVYTKWFCVHLKSWCFFTYFNICNFYFLISIHCIFH